MPLSSRCYFFYVSDLFLTLLAFTFKQVYISFYQLNQIGTKFKKARSYLENNQEETEEVTEIWHYISSKY